MGILSTIKRVTNFGYDATKSNKRRKVISVAGGTEERVLSQQDRRTVSDKARDARRNFAVAAWAIRKHLDYVSRFTFQARTGDQALNDQIEELIESWSLPSNFEEAGRHRLAKMLRIAEASRTVDGDVAWLLLRNGKVQGIESDRIRNPTGETAIAGKYAGDLWDMGVKLNKSGKHLGYAIHNRVNRGASFEFDRVVPAGNLLLHGYFDRYDQCRGVSPITASLNNYRDAYENFDYALAKAKIGQLFALAVFKNGIDEEDELNIDFESQGPIMAEFAIDEKVEMLESKTPSGEFLNFHQVIIGVALKSLDIPFSFYDESYTNFFGSKAALQHYIRSCKSKIEDVQELLNRWLIWRLRIAIITGEFEMPAGMTLFQLMRKLSWIPDGVPWWDPAKEVRGDLEQIGAGLSNPQRICRERGQGDFYENVDKIADAIEYAKSKGVPLSFMTAVTPAPVADVPPMGEQEGEDPDRETEPGDIEDDPEQEPADDEN